METLHSTISVHGTLWVTTTWDRSAARAMRGTFTCGLRSAWTAVSSPEPPWKVAPRVGLNLGFGVFENILF